MVHRRGDDEQVSWHSETVDAPLDIDRDTSTTVGRYTSLDIDRYTSLALDEDGYPHICYYEDINHDLKYAYQDASGWHIETVGRKTQYTSPARWRVGEYTSLALDAVIYSPVPKGLLVVNNSIAAGETQEFTFDYPADASDMEILISEVSGSITFRLFPDDSPAYFSWGPLWTRRVQVLWQGSVCYPS